MASSSQLEALAVLCQLVLLALAISIGHLLKRRGVLWIGGAGAALLLGVLVGVLIRLARTAPLVASWMVFQSDVFFLVLLPPIMFDACFNLDSRLFIKNVGSVCTLAFVGTTISTFAMGFNMWAAGKLKLCIGLTMLQALTFGALISATDPVTVLAIFNALGADPDLYMNVFGESVLNDAVAMVLYDTFRAFASQEVPVNSATILKGVASFFGIFLGSTVLGVLIAFAAAAVLQTRWYHGDVNLETGLMLLIGYGSYMAGTAAGLSGIVCVMFCAMTCGGYAAPNLSPGGLQASKGVYAVLASCMEQFVFVYIGVTLFMEPQEWHCIAFTAVCLFGLAWSRAANIIPCCAAVNFLRPPFLAMSRKHQFVLWWSGLRGAMAFALSVEAMKTFSEVGKVMMTCTFMVILITVLINGGSTGYLLSWYRLVQAKDDNVICSTGETQQTDVEDFAMNMSHDVEQMQLLLHDKLQQKLEEKNHSLNSKTQRQVVELNAAGVAGAKQGGQHGQTRGHISVMNSAFSAEALRHEMLASDNSGTASRTAAAMIFNVGGASVVSHVEQQVESGSQHSVCVASPAELQSVSRTSLGAGPNHVGNCSSRTASLQSAQKESSSSHAGDATVATSGASSAGWSGSSGILHVLRSNNHQLQDSLDRWDSAWFRRWFVNQASAQEHERWQQLHTHNSGHH